MINEHNKSKMKTFEITLQVEACSRSTVVALFEKLIKRPEVLQFRGSGRVEKGANNDKKSMENCA